MVASVAFLAYCLLVGYGFASQHPPQTRGIETEQKTKNAPTGENSAKPQTTESDGDIATNAKDGRADEGSEYWPSFLGLRLKITDSFLALFTFLLVVVGGIQGRLIRDQINLARDEFISTHRPKLIVRQFQLESADSDQPIKVAFSIINIGSTEATVRHITAQVVLWNGKHFEKPGINPLINPIANPVTIRNGQRISAKTKSEFNVTLRVASWSSVLSERLPTLTHWGRSGARVSAATTTPLPICSTLPPTKSKNTRIRAPACRSMGYPPLLGTSQVQDSRP